MSTWNQDELDSIADADDLHIAPFRDYGGAYGTPTSIWSVAVFSIAKEWRKAVLAFRHL